MDDGKNNEIVELAQDIYMNIAYRALDAGLTDQETDYLNAIIVQMLIACIVDGMQEDLVVCNTQNARLE
jgi:hypothetical protein